MKNIEICICGNKVFDKGLCEECLYLLRAKRSKNVNVIEKFRKDYNDKHNVYKSYGQFVLFIDMLDRRRKEVDNRRKKAAVKKVRSIR